MSLLYVLSETLAAGCLSHGTIFKTATTLVLGYDGELLDPKSENETGKIPTDLFSGINFLNFTAGTFFLISR